MIIFAPRVKPASEFPAQDGGQASPGAHGFSKREVVRTKSQVEVATSFSFSSYIST